MSGDDGTQETARRTVMIGDLDLHEQYEGPHLKLFKSDTATAGSNVILGEILEPIEGAPSTTPVKGPAAQPPLRLGTATPAKSQVL